MFPRCLADAVSSLVPGLGHVDDVPQVEADLGLVFGRLEVEVKALEGLYVALRRVQLVEVGDGRVGGKHAPSVRWNRQLGTLATSTDNKTNNGIFNKIDTAESEIHGTSKIEHLIMNSHIQ